MLQAVIWDLNGVIIDDMHFHLESFRAFMKQFGYEVSEEYFLAKCVGATPVAVFTDILPAIGSPISVEEAVERKRSIYFELIRGKMEMLPGVRRLIEDFSRAGIKQAIASGATRIEVETILQEFGISELFDAVVACEDVVNSKPDPEPFLTAANRLGAHPAGCLVIEDGDYGVRAAKMCGIKVVGVTNTQSRRELAAADVIVDSLEEVSAAWALDLLSEPELV